MPERPAVTRGARVTSFVWFAVAALGAVMLLLVSLSSGFTLLLGKVGVGEPATVAVTTNTFVERPALTWRGASCDYHRIEVEWGDRTGHLTACVNQPAADLQPGDSITAWTNPWTDEVLPDDDGAYVWSAVGLVVGAWMLGQGLVSGLHYRRLLRRGAGDSFDGRVTAVRHGVVRVAPDDGDRDQRDWSLLPADARPRVAVGDRLTLWSSRRGWGGRPRGPWAVESGGQVTTYTHAWRRRR